MYTSLMNAVSTSVNTFALGHCELARKTKSMIDAFTVQLGKSSGEDLQKFINNFQLQKELKPASMDRAAAGSMRIIPLHEIMYNKSIEILFDNFVDKTVGVVLLFVEHLKFNACDHDTHEIEKIQKQFEDLKSSHANSAPDHDANPYTHKYSNLYQKLNGDCPSENSSLWQDNLGFDTEYQTTTSDNSDNESIITTINNTNATNIVEYANATLDEYTNDEVVYDEPGEYVETFTIDTTTHLEIDSTNDSVLTCDVYDYTELPEVVSGCDDTTATGALDGSADIESIPFVESACMIDMPDETPSV